MRQVIDVAIEVTTDGRDTTTAYVRVDELEAIGVAYRAEDDKYAYTVGRDLATARALDLITESLYRSYETRDAANEAGELPYESRRAPGR